MWEAGCMQSSLNKLISDQTLVKLSSFIDGNWLPSRNHFSVYDPATNNKLADVSDVQVTDVEVAIQAAYRAQENWSMLSANERATIMLKWFDLIIEHQEDLATLLTLEQGKPLMEARGEISYGASYIQWFAEEGKRAYGDVIPANSNGQRIVVLKQGVGVVAAITPWNFPNAMITRKAAAALAAGCSFIVKPSELTPLSALALAELALQAGIPKGVFNVVVGTDAKAIGQVLTTHPLIAKFSFTGSTAVGKQLMAQSATTVKRLSMELGGNAPFIVFDDADIDAAVEGVIASKFRNAGQTCVCTNRIFVDNKVKQQFTEKLIASVRHFTIGSGLDSTVNIGPLISKVAVDKVEALTSDAVKAGASVLIGGARSEYGQNFFMPTVITNVNNEMAIAQSEIFGPVACIIGFDKENEAIEWANATEYGLAAYFYSQNIKRIWRVADVLQFGMLGINEGIISNAAAPFGGIKQSGYGREGSKYGLDDYMQTKYLCLGGLA